MRLSSRGEIAFPQCGHIVSRERRTLSGFTFFRLTMNAFPAEVEWSPFDDVAVQVGLQVFVGIAFVVNKQLIVLVH